jgi:glycosyltransferase involved in cell wall biosynthesis
MKALHVCLLSQEYPPDTGWGGIGAYTYELAHGLVRAGQRVTVLARAAGPESVVQQDGIDVHRLQPSPDWSRWRGLWRLNGIWPGFAWAAARRLRHIHAACRVDVVEAPEGRADSLFVPLLVPGLRVIVRLHTAWIFVDRLNGVAADRKKRFVYWQEARAIRAANLVTAPSQGVVDLTATWVPLRRRAVRVIPNPVNVHTYSPCGCANTPTEALVVGRLEQRKGAALLAEALPQVLRRCPHSAFRFAGSDGVDAQGRSWRARLLEGVPAAERHRVHFEQVPRDELLDRYRRAAVCVLPSVWENFPYALLEAMACGVPVIGTRTGGLPELIEDGVSGLVIPPGDVAALTEALCMVLGDTELRNRLGRAARQRAQEKFSVEAVVPRMLDLYRAVRDGGLP